MVKNNEKLKIKPNTLKEEKSSGETSIERRKSGRDTHTEREREREKRSDIWYKGVVRS